MAGCISGNNKFDLVLGPTTITTSLTSNYVDMSKYDKVIFIAQAGTMTSTDAITMSAVQAKSSTGSGTVVMNMYSTINGTPGVLGQVTKVTECVLAGSSETFGLEGGTVVVNGLTYTFDCSSDCGYTTGSFNATRTVVTTTAPAAGGSSEPEQALGHFAAYINHPQYGVPGVVATVSAATSNVTLTANDHIGEASITCLPSVGDTGIWISKAIGTLEVHSAQLATSSDFNFVCCQSSVVGTSVVHYSVAAIRSGARFSPDTTALYQYNFGTT